MTVAVLAPHDVPTTLNYYIPDPSSDETPYTYVYDPPEGKKGHNLGAEPHDVVVRDARDKEKEYGLSLDTSGFQFVKHASEEKDFEDEQRIETAYYKEVEELLKKEVGAKRVFIFDHTIRRKPGTPSPEGKLIRGPVVRRLAPRKLARILTLCTCRNVSTLTRPSMRPSPASTAISAPTPSGSSRAASASSTCGAPSTTPWRTSRSPCPTGARSTPSTISSPSASSTLTESEVRAGTHKNPVLSAADMTHNSTGTFSVRYNPEHRWYYLSNQAPDEVTLIKCYDSEEDRARLTPHSAFLDKSSPEGAPHRESIEVRCLVFDTE